MTATEELRRMLDERGAEWWEATPCKTKWNSPIIGGPVAARVWNGEMVLDVGYESVTPAQAIDATLGRGTCHNVHEPPKDATFWPAPHFKCSECGATHVSMEYVFYCPNCGAKVVD